MKRRPSYIIFSSGRRLNRKSDAWYYPCCPSKSICPREICGTLAITGRCLYLIADCCSLKTFICMCMHYCVWVAVPPYLPVMWMRPFERLLERRITSTHPFSSGVPLTLSRFERVLFFLVLLYGRQAVKLTSVYLPECYRRAGNSQLQTEAAQTPTQMM